MSKNQGSALLWLLYTVAIFTLLSSSLLKLALSDLRVSGHLINAERAQYAAEAGIEYAVAVLPWRWRELAAGSWQYEQQEDPCFTGSAQRENSSLLRIHAQGRAGGMVRDVEVLASLRPFARQALIARQLWGQAITVVGHVAADEVVFRTDSYIDGDLRLPGWNCRMGKLSLYRLSLDAGETIHPGGRFSPACAGSSTAGLVGG